ncbi:hypothetical protein ACH5RR_016471 [Cinchona calisaya]|uniref:Enhancer of polycomb-like protein n=1 Tax=Cinchona calisaya TaxID=153742 RepID=A0ABD2ZZQ2_9GENT
MPSVGMRRTTRVFGARVLRSGRRLWTGPGNGKYIKSTNRDEWIELLEISGDGGGSASQRKERGRHGNDVAPKLEVMRMDVDEKLVESASKKVAHEGLLADKFVGRRWGVVYTRKRKKMESSVAESSVNANKKRNLDDKRFGKKYFRKQWRKKITHPELAKACVSNVDLVSPEGLHDNDRSQSLMVVVDSSCCSWYLFTCFLNSVLRYVRRARIDLQKLSGFLRSKTIASVYSSCGIWFLQGCNLVTRRGVCVIWDTSYFIPVFAADYSAVPYYFMYLHSRMLLQSARFTCSLGLYLVGIDVKDDKILTSRFVTVNNQASDVVIASRIGYSGKREVSCSNVGAAKFAGRNLKLRNGCNIQKRSSLRSKRGRRPSSFGARKVNGALASNLFNFRHNGIQLSPIAPRRELRSSAFCNAATNLKQVKSVLVGLKQDVDPRSCSANILVMDSDKCYRVEGAIITLQVSADKQWHLAIKGDGMNRYTIIAQKFMRPCSCNHVTHAIIWGTDNGWKLEFPDRRDWLIFKELYKECLNCNAQVHMESFIPVPGVLEVSGYEKSSVVFLQPASYISLKDDELSRALARGTANYDMDSDDEQWLNKLNSEISAENESQKHLSPENFELLIDAFEKGFHCNPDDFFDETAPPNIYLNLERRVVEPVYSFWIKKRKQRRSALVRIFQLYQPRRSQLKPNSVLRKKRSFKRQGSQIGKGKQRPFVQAVAVEQDSHEQQNAVLKVEEAKAAANGSESLAVIKRQRAQQLMESADLATYKATMALKIAELAQIAESLDTVGIFSPVM